MAMWRDSGKVLTTLGFILSSFSTMVVVLRLYCRHFRMHAVGVSDYIMFVALLSTWASTTVNYYQVKFGRDARLKFVEEDSTSPRIQAAVAGTLHTWFIYRPLYILTLSLVKLSILTFYRTLVPPFAVWRSLRSFRYITHTLVIFTMLYAISMIAASIFQCTPLSAAFSVSASLSLLPGHRNIPPPHCFNPSPLWVFSAINNFATDVVVLLLPIPVILSLQHMPRREKVNLLCMFSIGTVAIAASAVRMWILVLWGKDVKSQGKYGTELLIWGQIEVNCGIVSASVIFLRPLFKWGKERIRGKPEGTDRAVRRVQENEMTTFSASFAASEIDGRLGVEAEEKQVPAQML